MGDGALADSVLKEGGCGRLPVPPAHDRQQSEQMGGSVHACHWLGQAAPQSSWLQQAVLQPGKALTPKVLANRTLLGQAMLLCLRHSGPNSSSRSKQVIVVC